MRAVQVTEFGGPEVLTLTELPGPVADAGFEVRQVDSTPSRSSSTRR